ncbi:MAG TPA: sigma-70 family RNA polymerase sigma factor [Candidatus Limnocylindrales bacterium]|nr:sigma-70 family RNA polymerase sigma factor [Candidatus Limnocylindrales bacterium]
MSDNPAVPGRLPDPSDEALLAGLAAGRLEDLDALYERYKTMAYGIARRITADDVLAEDVVQDAFLGAWRSADRYVPGRGSVKTWLLSIVHHRAIDAIRRRRPASELPAEVDGVRTPASLTFPDVWGEVSGRLDRETVGAALAVLPEAQREAVELAYFAGLTQTEIATRTGVPLGTVKGRVRLALVTLRRELTGSEAGP